MDGPRAVHEDEMSSLEELVGRVFRPTMFPEYPQLFNLANRENLRVCVEDGKVVSHVGMIERWASIYGCTVKLCCVGAVSTHPDYRGRGFASACFDDAVRKAEEDGVDVMLVSGNRKLYEMRGCLRVGSEHRYTVDRDVAGRLAGIPGLRLTVADDELMVNDWYRNEPLRFVRPWDDCKWAFQSQRAMNHPIDWLVVQDSEVDYGYWLVHRAERGGIVNVVEYAGDRRALISAVPLLLDRYEAAAVRWRTAADDLAFCAACHAAGLGLGERVPTAPTVKLINFPQFMERLRPRWEELLSIADVAKLSFERDGDDYVFRSGDSEWRTDRDGATLTLFGTVEEKERWWRQGYGPISELLEIILPVPLPWYGINYV